MENSTLWRTEAARPDFTAFAAGVQARLPQLRTLPPAHVQGVERLGRLVQLLRTRYHWSLELLAAKTGLPWLWLALLEQGVLLPSEVTAATLQQLGQVFPPQRRSLNSEVLFRTVAEDLLGVPLPDPEAEAPRAARAGGRPPAAEEPQPPARVGETARHARPPHHGRWLSPAWHPQWAGEERTADATLPQTQVLPLADGDITVTCEWWPAYRDLPAILRVAWHARLSVPGDFWVRFTAPDDPERLLAPEIRLGSTPGGEARLTAEALGFDPTRQPWALAVVLQGP